MYKLAQCCKRTP